METKKPYKPVSKMSSVKKGKTSSHSDSDNSDSSDEFAEKKRSQHQTQRRKRQLSRTPTNQSLTVSQKSLREMHRHLGSQMISSATSKHKEAPT